MLVTGSSSGIGEQIARRFADARRLGGGELVDLGRGRRTDRRRARRQRGLRPGRHQRREQAAALIEAVVERFGKLDVLVNNAGWTTRVDHRDLDGLTDEIFRQARSRSTCSARGRLTKAAIPHLRDSDDGNIVNITSIAGLRPVGSSMAYSMSKAALNQMTLLLAKSYAPIRVNAVAPGLVATPWTSEWSDLHEAMAQRSPVRSRRRRPTMSPRRRWRWCATVT